MLVDSCGRQAISRLPDQEVIDKLFGDLSKRFKDRDGGFTRMYNLGPRPGDAAPIVRIELV